MNGTRKSGPSEYNEKRSTDKPVEDTGTQMLMSGLKIDNFDESILLPDVLEQFKPK